ncbi:MAG: efflux RND transporter permease subunit [Chromatiaceae bacterium]|nr:efflux RND transporter permease subunit [Chromatiaceae bacterium]MCP5316148.1 efflux RND transporter permease subunit [Chromatiaceae bacterium]
MAFQHRNDIIGLFAQHKVAANLLMVVMLLAGTWGLAHLNVQFFPNFEIEMVTVTTAWSGASAEDVERSITVPLEQTLRTTDGLDKMSSTSSQGLSLITLEFPEGTDMGAATDRVEELVNAVRNLPADAEATEVSHVLRYEPVARLLVHGPPDIRELRPLVRRMERELLDRGIAKVTITGLPEDELAIQIPQATLEDLGLSLQQVAQRVAAGSRDLPAGTVGRDDVGREVRTLDQRRTELGFEQLVLRADREGRLVRVADVAEVERRPRPNQVALTFQEQPTVELQLMRSTSADSLVSARIMHDWLDEARLRYPPDVTITPYDEHWTLIEDRINLLLKNGGSGLLLVVGILFLFLNGRVAFWVAVGIPVSFMATLAIVYLAGGSINMISLFALIMALGIIVDDAIVVGEDALTHYQTGESSLEAAEGGARRMFAPVMSSSLTTIAAFLPLFAISGFIGKFLGDIPFVIVCVIIASLFESFLVLPGHLRHSFRGLQHAEPGRFRRRWDAGFAHFRDRYFRALVTWAVNNRVAIVSIALATVIVLFGVLRGGRMGFSFFPNVEGNGVVASATFVAGTPPERVKAFAEHLESQLYATDRALGGGLVQVANVALGRGFFSNGRQEQTGDQFASVTVELLPSDQRAVRNEEFIETWEASLVRPPGLEYLTITSRTGGHPGRDLEVRLVGPDADALKRAALELADALSAIPGVQAIEDDMPYGQQQLVFRVSPLGESLGLTVQDVGRQMRAAFDGELAQIFNEGDEEIEVRVMLPDRERYRLSALDDLNVVLPGGGSVPLMSVVDLQERRGFKAIRHAEGRLAATVYADVNKQTANANEIRALLRSGVLPTLAERHDLSWEFTGRAEDQRDTASDMQKGALFALAMIYIVLAWVFGSYGWPLVVMAIIPFGIVGALFGHLFMGITPTILSMFGLFALSGIVVNDSIILVVFYKQLRERGMGVREAIVEAACQRLRAVLLTSLTTIAGLLPLLFETSLQAQFLIPMAVSISFGLAFATFLVLLLVPALLSALEGARLRLTAAVAPGEA